MTSIKLKPIINFMDSVLKQLGLDAIYILDYLLLLLLLLQLLLLLLLQLLLLLLLAASYCCC